MAEPWDDAYADQYMRRFRNHPGPEVSREQALRAVALTRCPPGGAVLDCPCGFGRHSVPLAGAGYRVTGVDRSMAMLAGIGEAPLLPAGLSVAQADYRTLPFPDRCFDVILNLFTSIGLDGEMGTRSALAEFRRLLRRDGSLVIETTHRDRVVASRDRSSWELLDDGVVVLAREDFDVAASVLRHTNIHLSPGGQQRAFGSEMRIYTPTELTALLQEAGFRRIELHGGLDGSPLTEATRLVVVASPEG